MLTQLAISNAKPKAKPYKLSDGAGLSLLVEKTGSRLWRFRYFFGGKEKMLSFGAYPDVPLAQARAKRDEARQTLAGGIDPAQKRREDKVAASISAANTFGVVAAECSSSDGNDDCSSEFRRLKNAESDFESAVSEHQIDCNQ